MSAKDIQDWIKQNLCIQNKAAAYNKQENKVVRPVSVFARINKMKSWIFFISMFVLFLFKAFLGD